MDKAQRALRLLLRRNRKRSREQPRNDMPMPSGAPCCSAREILSGCISGLCQCKPCIGEVLTSVADTANSDGTNGAFVPRQDQRG
jgi:hypothetical protein